jgi:hypothetical protein
MALKAIDESSLAWMPKSVWGPIKWKELHVRARGFFGFLALARGFASDSSKSTKPVSSTAH